MARRGPHYFAEAADLLSKARHERNQTERMQMLAAAQVNATLALVAATLHAGNLTREELQPWAAHGFKV